jgi:hypothetical protein
MKKIKKLTLNSRLRSDAEIQEAKIQNYSKKNNINKRFLNSKNNKKRIKKNSKIGV